jgi:bacterioferritin
MNHPQRDNIVKALNEILLLELTGINQFYMHARMLKNWGYERLSEIVQHRSIDEMKHAQRFVDRILYFEGGPNLQKIGPLRIGESVVEMLQSDYEHEKKLVETMRAHIQNLLKWDDPGSRTLVEEMLRDEEDDIDWFEAQLELVEQMGEAHYLAQQMKES